MGMDIRQHSIDTSSDKRLIFPPTSTDRSTHFSTSEFTEKSLPQLRTSLENISLEPSSNEQFAPPTCDTSKPPIAEKRRPSLFSKYFSRHMINEQESSKQPQRRFSANDADGFEVFKRVPSIRRSSFCAYPAKDAESFKFLRRPPSLRRQSSLKFLFSPKEKSFNSSNRNSVSSTATASSLFTLKSALTSGNSTNSCNSKRKYVSFRSKTHSIPICARRIVIEEASSIDEESIEQDSTLQLIGYDALYWTLRDYQSFRETSAILCRAVGPKIGHFDFESLREGMHSNLGAAELRRMWEKDHGENWWFKYGHSRQGLRKRFKLTKKTVQAVLKMQEEMMSRDNELDADKLAQCYETLSRFDRLYAYNEGRATENDIISNDNRYLE